MVYGGSRRLKAGSVEVWPLETFLHALEQDELWP